MYKLNQARINSHKGQAYQAAFNMETVEAEPPIKGRRQGVSL